MVLGIIVKKLKTALRVYQTQGAQKVFSIIATRLRYRFAAITLPLQGKTIVVDGCRFDLSDPLITREAKIALFAGQYEEYERPAIRRFIPRGLPVIELGGGMGVVSCTTNRLLKNPNAHLVVEANPQVLKLAEKHRAMNHCNFTILNAALGYESQEIELYINDFFVYSSSKAKTKNSIKVKTVTLQELVQELHAGVVSVICDIEGMEVDLVAHELDFMSNHVGVFLLEEHSYFVGREAINAMFQQLEQHQFERIHHAGDVYVFLNRRIFPQETPDSLQSATV
jgi:FkbM family methyltransferase